MIDVGQMPTTTIQQRLREVCALRGVSPEALSTAAGLSRGYISRIINGPDRKGLRGEEGYRIAFEAKVSLSYLLYGTGSILGPDVPKEPPPPKPGQSRRVADAPDWEQLVRAAIEHEPKLDWALMGVGESAMQPGEEPTVYSLLADAERFKRTCTDTEERARLDEKARAFRKIRRPNRAGVTPPKKSSSSPPKH